MDVLGIQAAIDALKICDNNEDGINCYKCPLRDERWDGAWQDDETSCYRKLMRDSAELLSAQLEPCEYYALCRHGRDENKLRARLGVCEYCNKDSDGYVKPVEKNGHAFIRFGMNGWELSLKANRWHGSAKIRYCPMCGRDLLVK